MVLNSITDPRKTIRNPKTQPFLKPRINTMSAIFLVIELKVCPGPTTGGRRSTYFSRPPSPILLSAMLLS
jgi:hypothetical protein